MSFKEVRVYFLMLQNKRVGWQLSFIWAPKDRQRITRHWRDVICSEILQDLICCTATQGDCCPWAGSFPSFGRWEEVGGQTSWVVYI